MEDITALDPGLYAFHLDSWFYPLLRGALVACRPQPTAHRTGAAPARAASSPAVRCAQIAAQLTWDVFGALCRGTLQRHHLSVALRLALGAPLLPSLAPPSEIDDAGGGALPGIDAQELRAVLSSVRRWEGGVGMEQCEGARTGHAWIDDEAWERIATLSGARGGGVPCLRGLADDLTAHSDAWQQWVAAAVESSSNGLALPPLPPSWSSPTPASPLLGVLVAQAVCPALVVRAAQDLITARLGPAYTEAPPVDWSQLVTPLPPSMQAGRQQQRQFCSSRRQERVRAAAPGTQRPPYSPWPQAWACQWPR